MLQKCSRPREVDYGVHYKTHVRIHAPYTHDTHWRECRQHDRATAAAGPRPHSGLARPPAPCPAREARPCRASSTTWSVVFTWSVVSRNQQVSSCNSLIHLPFAREDPGREDNCSRGCRHTCLALSAAVTPGGLPRLGRYHHAASSSWYTRTSTCVITTVF